jgi:DNA-binding response OmpR family regulator
MVFQTNIASEISFGCVSKSFSRAIPFVVGFSTTYVKMQSGQPIMIVDDEPDITCIMKKILQLNGIVVDSFNDAEVALHHFKLGVYGLAILDIKMPKMNGFQLYNEIRKIDPEVKVCFLSAYETFGEQLGFPKTEVRCILKKPIRMTELVKHVRLETVPLVT